MNVNEQFNRSLFLDERDDDVCPTRFVNGNHLILSGISIIISLFFSSSPPLL